MLVRRLKLVAIVGFLLLGACPAVRLAAGRRPRTLRVGATWSYAELHLPTIQTTASVDVSMTTRLAEKKYRTGRSSGIALVGIGRDMAIFTGESEARLIY